MSATSTLPLPDAVLMLPDGKQVMPDGTILDPAANMAQEVLNATQSVALVTKMRRSLGDLPDIPKNLNPVCVVMAYSAVGIDDDGIALALNTDADTIKRLKESDSYIAFEKMFDERIFDDEQRNARHILSKSAAVAANKMVSLVHSQSGDLALAASRDVLRIGGVDKSAQSNGLSSLKIVMVDKETARNSEITVTIE